VKNLVKNKERCGEKLIRGEEFEEFARGNSAVNK